jgi:AraC family transcriptional regulator
VTSWRRGCHTISVNDPRARYQNLSLTWSKAQTRRLDAKCLQWNLTEAQVSASIEAQAAIAAENRRTPATSGRGACETGGASRARLLESSIGLVEDLRCPAMPLRRSGEAFSADYQVCLPYRGLFVWHVGDGEVVGDPNQVLFVSAGESYYLSQPLSRDYAELIITPDLELLSELADGHAASLSFHPLFRRRSRRVDLGLQDLRTRFLHSASCGECNGLVAEESVITLLRWALKADAGAPEASRSTRLLIGRTKEFLEANLSGSIRLGDIARGVGASPAYLTDVFRRVEGVPLHRYLMQLRLARALVELPHASDLTTLALELGFSSHSHFTAVFRRGFGCTPSRFRESTRSELGLRVKAPGVEAAQP